MLICISRTHETSASINSIPYTDILKDKSPAAAVAKVKWMQIEKRSRMDSSLELSQVGLILEWVQWSTWRKMSFALLSSCLSSRLLVACAISAHYCCNQPDKGYNTHIGLGHRAQAMGLEFMRVLIFAHRHHVEHTNKGLFAGQVEPECWIYENKNCLTSIGDLIMLSFVAA